MTEQQTMLNAAIALAAKHHEGQYDKGGVPYFCHVMEVYRNVNSDDEELNCIAILHDIIEDTKATYQDLAAVGMTERVIEGVRLMTKQRGQTYAEYKAGVLSTVDSMLVKQADIKHNMNITRLKGVSPKDTARLGNYSIFYTEIKTKLKELGIKS